MTLFAVLATPAVIPMDVPVGGVPIPSWVVIGVFLIVVGLVGTILHRIVDEWVRKMFVKKNGGSRNTDSITPTEWLNKFLEINDRMITSLDSLLTRQQITLSNQEKMMTIQEASTDRCKTLLDSQKQIEPVLQNMASSLETTNKTLKSVLNVANDTYRLAQEAQETATQLSEDKCPLITVVHKELQPVRELLAKQQT